MIKSKFLNICLLLALFVFPVIAEESGSAAPAFEMDLGLATQTFNEVLYDANGDVILDIEGNPEIGPVTYQNLNIQPEFAFGKFGIGMDISLNFRFTDESGDFDIREADWVPTSFQNFLDLYLPMFRYVRYGYKGEPLYGKLGIIEDGTLGNGFIIGNYANTNFLPDIRAVGFSFDLDGKLFNFPYLGIETFIGNLAKFDVFGTRLFTRPLYWLELPILKELEFGVTFAADFNPDSYYDFTSYPAAFTPEAVSMFGFDLFQPIIANQVVTLAAYGDLVIQPKDSGSSVGGMLGAGGKLFGLVPYGIQLRLLGENFVPVYFDASYDLYRESKYRIFTGADTSEGFAGWLASLGFSLLDDQLLFNASIDGPFILDSTSTNYLLHPHLKVIFLVQEGILPGFTFKASMDRKFLDQAQDWNDFWQSDMVIGAEINYDTGPAVLTLSYDLRYDPEAAADDESPWIKTAKLSSTFNLF